MNRALATSQIETLKTCWTLWQANGASGFKLGLSNASRVQSLVKRGYLTKHPFGQTLKYKFTQLGIDMSVLHFGPKRLSDRAVPATDGKPGGPAKEDSASSPPSAGPPGAVTFPLAKLTLQVKVDLNMPVPEGLALQMSKLLGEWSNGRKLFSVEQVESGLLDVVRMAAYHAVEAKYREIFGNEMVERGGGSQSSRACLAAEEVVKNMRLRFYNVMECTGATASAPFDDGE